MSLSQVQRVWTYSKNYVKSYVLAIIPDADNMQILTTDEYNSLFERQLLSFPTKICYSNTMHKVIEHKVSRKDAVANRETKFWQDVALQQQRLLHAKYKT